MTGLLAAIGAFLGVRLSVRGNDRATRQRDLAARREEWWRRFTWAAELALDDSADRRAAGLRVLTQLALSDLSRRDEHLILSAYPGRVLRESGLDTDAIASATEEQVAAAQLMIVLDRKLGYDTPEYVGRLAGSFQAEAIHNRRMHTILEAIALAGSIASASLIAAKVGDSPLLWCAAAGNALAATATGFLIYFKFQDRAANLLHAADAIDGELGSAEQSRQ